MRRHMADLLLAGLVLVTLLGVGFLLGRNYERTNTLAAEPTPAVVSIGPRAAAARVNPQCPKSNVRGPKSGRILGTGPRTSDRGR